MFSFGAQDLPGEAHLHCVSLTTIVLGRRRIGGHSPPYIADDDDSRSTRRDLLGQEILDDGHLSNLAAIRLIDANLNLNPPQRHGIGR